MARDTRPGVFTGVANLHVSPVWSAAGNAGGSIGLASEGHSSQAGPEIRYLKGTWREKGSHIHSKSTL